MICRYTNLFILTGPAWRELTCIIISYCQMWGPDSILRSYIKMTRCYFHHENYIHWVCLSFPPANEVSPGSAIHIRMPHGSRPAAKRPWWGGGEPGRLVFSMLGVYVSVVRRAYVLWGLGRCGLDLCLGVYDFYCWQDNISRGQGITKCFLQCLEDYVCDYSILFLDGM